MNAYSDDNEIVPWDSPFRKTSTIPLSSCASRNTSSPAVTVSSRTPNSSSMPPSVPGAAPNGGLA